jgi:homoserine kinase
MGFSASSVTVTVPATSANLGPGFDVLGVALSMYDKITARVTGDQVRVSVSGEGADELPKDEGHLVAETMLRTFKELGCQPPGFELKCANEIPQARGMGSSSAAIVAGVLLAQHLVEGGPEKLSMDDLIRLAAEIEGHPDNVAPCLLGGFTIAWTDDSGPPDDGAHAVKLDDVKGVALVIFVPVQRGYTAHARAVLPINVPLKHATFNSARCALLVRALTASPELLFAATDDRIHQEARAPAMPDTAKLVTALRAAGIAAVVSGSGPSVLALVPNNQRCVRKAQSQCPDGWWAREMAIATKGAHVR